MFIEHQAGELASISERGQVPAGLQKIVTSNTCWGAGATITKGVNEDKLVGETKRVKRFFRFIGLHNTNVNDNNVSDVA